MRRSLDDFLAGDRATTCPASGSTWRWPHRSSGRCCPRWPPAPATGSGPRTARWPGGSAARSAARAVGAALGANPLCIVMPVPPGGGVVRVLDRLRRGPGRQGVPPGPRDPPAPPDPAVLAVEHRVWPSKPQSVGPNVRRSNTVFDGHSPRLTATATRGGGLLRGGGTSGGRRAACRRSGRWGSTAATGRRTTPRGPCPRRPGRADRSPVHGHPGSLGVLQLLRRLAPGGHDAPRSRTERVAAYSRSTCSSVSEPAIGVRRELGRVQDLVAVRVAHTGEQGLVAQHALDLRAPPGQHGRERRPVEGRVQRVRPERRDPGHLLRVA